MISPAIPLGMIVSANTSALLPIPRVRKPLKQTAPSSRAARQVEAASQRKQHHQAAGEDVSDGDEVQGRKRLQRHADAQVRRPPEEAHGDEGQVSLEQRIAAQIPA